MNQTLPIHLRRALPAVAALAALAAAAPVAHAATRTIADEPRATLLAAWDGDIAWSHYDAAASGYLLVVSHDGAAARTLPVDPSPVPFDVDLGTSRTGATTAVYTRCAEAPTRRAPRGTDCDIYRLRLDGGREQRLTKLSAPRWDERDPTIFRGRIAFIRHERSHGRMRDVLRIGDTTSGSRGTQALVKAGALREPELSNNRVAYVRTARGRFGPSMQVHVRALRSGHDRVVYRANSGGANFANVTGPSVSDSLRSFLWVRTNLGSGSGNRVVRYNVGTRRLAYATGVRSSTDSSGWAGGELGMALSESLQGTCSPTLNGPPTLCRVAVTGPLSFSARP